MEYTDESVAKIATIYMTLSTKVMLLSMAPSQAGMESTRREMYLHCRNQLNDLKAIAPEGCQRQLEVEKLEKKLQEFKYLGS